VLRLEHVLLRAGHTQYRGLADQITCVRSQHQRTRSAQTANAHARNGWRGRYSLDVLSLPCSVSLSLSRSLSLCVRLRTLCLSLALFRCAGVTCDSSLTEPHSKTHTHQKHRRSSAGLDYHWLVRARPAGWRRSAAAERRQCPSEAPLPDLDCLDHAVFLEEVRIMTRTAYDLHRNIGESQSLLLFLS
jgi:hypothetical protein